MEIIRLSRRVSSCLKPVLTTLFCIWFALTSTLTSIVHAQSAGSDFEAPIIEHEEISSGVLGDVESFVATVVDNEELDSVSLFYRYAGDADFIEISMQPLAESSYYTATVDTSLRDGSDTAIEYYIRAEDASGNLVLKGFAFEPLVRSLIDDSPATSPTVVTEQPAPPTEPAPRKKVNWLYVGLGILLVGGIAAGAGGGGGGSDPVDPTCSPNCSVTLTLATP